MVISRPLYWGYAFLERMLRFSIFINGSITKKQLKNGIKAPVNEEQAGFYHHQGFFGLYYNMPERSHAHIERVNAICYPRD